MQYTRLKMHKYIWIGVAVFAAFAASFPIAMMRVSQTDKFSGQPLNSWTCEGQVPPQRTVTQFTTCTQLKATSNSAQ
jgi:hypothetical protein